MWPPLRDTLFFAVYSHGHLPDCRRITTLTLFSRCREGMCLMRALVVKDFTVSLPISCQSDTTTIRSSVLVMPLIFHTVYNSRRNFLTNSRLNHHLLYSFACSQKQLKQNVQIQNFYYSLRLKTLKKIQLDHDSN